MPTTQHEALASRLALADDDALLSVRELAEFLNRSKSSIYRDILAGRIESPTKIGKSSRWRVGYARSLTRNMEGA